MAEYIEREMIKTCFAQIIVNNSEDKPYYSIMYWENGAMNIGFSSYNLDYVRRWLNEEFEVKRNVDVTLVKRAHWFELDGMQICSNCSGGKASVQCKHTETYDVWENHPVLCAKYRVGCEKCGIYFWQLHEIQLTDGQPTVIKNGYDEAAEAWNRRTNDEV